MRRLQSHGRCRNQTPVEALTRAAMAMLERVAMVSFWTRHVPSCKVIFSSPPSVRKS